MNGVERILVVEDDEGMRMSCRQALEEAGHEVVEAGSVPEAEPLLLRDVFDLVITDLRMPHGGGQEMLRIVKQVSPEVPVVLITAYPSVESAIEAFRGGVTDYLLKPFTSEQLIETVRNAIVRTALEEGLELEEIEEIEAATKQRVEIGEIDRRNMSKEDRLFVYAVASWMTRLDGRVTEAELGALRGLGDALKVPDKPRQYADQIAQEVAELSADDRPARYDLVALRRIIGDRLREAQARRDAGDDA
jgi:DNA-binding response OmpR family regulator